MKAQKGTEWHGAKLSLCKVSKIQHCSLKELTKQLQKLNSTRLYKQCSFAFHVAIICNSFPNEIKDCTSLTSLDNKIRKTTLLGFVVVVFNKGHIDYLVIFHATLGRERL